MKYRDHYCEGNRSNLAVIHLCLNHISGLEMHNAVTLWKHLHQVLNFANT